MSVTHREERGDQVGRDLVMAHLGGDPDAFDEIVRCFYPSLLGHARRRLRDERLAEDVVQEAFLRAYRALPNFGGDYQLGPWLHRITANVCTTEGTRRSRERMAQQRWMSQPAEDVLGPDEYPEHVEALARVLSAIEQLPSRYREAIVLRDVMDLDYAAVADRSGISEQNARARVSRARAALRKIVEPTAAFGALFGRALRRGSRWAPRIYNQISTSANAVSEAANMPARASAFTAVATTSVAAMAVAVPFIGNGLVPSQQASPPAQVVAGVTVPPASASRTTVQVGVASVSPVAVAGAAPTSSTSTSTTTSTLARVPAANVVAPVVTSTTTPADAGMAELVSDDIPAEFGQGLAQEPGTLSVVGADPVHGLLVGQLNLPKQGAAACTGSLSGQFSWGAPSSSDHKLTMSTGFVSASSGSDGSTVYDLLGTANVVGGIGAFNGYAAVYGTLTVVKGASAGTADLHFTGWTPSSPAPTCPAGASGATSSSSSSSSSTTSTTSAGGASSPSAKGAVTH